MIAEIERKSRPLLWGGFFGMVAGRVMMAIGSGNNSPLTALGALITIVCLVLFLWGCCLYAVAKGHSRWLGLLGLLSLIGLIILVVLPDRYKRGTVVPGQMTPSAVLPPPYAPTSADEQSAPKK